MFSFREELAKYRESLAVSDLEGGMSGDEVRDVLDIAKQLTGKEPSRPTYKQNSQRPDASSSRTPSHTPSRRPIVIAQDESHE